MDKKEMKEQVGRNIQAIRIREDLTRTELADKMNVDARTIQYWEQDGTKDVFLLLELANVFQCDIHDFLLKLFPTK